MYFTEACEILFCAYRGRKYCKKSLWSTKSPIIREHEWENYTDKTIAIPGPCHGIDQLCKTCFYIGPIIMLLATLQAHDIVYF